MDLKFRNYCLVVMGDTIGIHSEIDTISDINPPNILDAKGLLIATFSSVASPSELKDFFKSKNRNFLIFDLDSESSGFHITKKEIHNGLFGFLKTMNLDNKTDKLIKEIKEIQKKTNSNTKIVSNDITELDINKMSKNEKDNLLNKLLENGIENLSEYDKKILPFLAK